MRFLRKSQDSQSVVGFADEMEDDWIYKHGHCCFQRSNFLPLLESWPRAWEGFLEKSGRSVGVGDQLVGRCCIRSVDMYIGSWDGVSPNGWV